MRQSLLDHIRNTISGNCCSRYGINFVIVLIGIFRIVIGFRNIDAYQLT